MVTHQLLDEISQGQGQPLKVLARLVPSYRQGKPATISRLFRWIFNGRKLPTGETVHLEAVRTPGGWVSTPAAIGRFFAAMTPEVGAREPQAKPRTSSARQRAAERAAKRLEAAGIA